MILHRILYVFFFFLTFGYTPLSRPQTLLGFISEVTVKKGAGSIPPVSGKPSGPVCLGANRSEALFFCSPRWLACAGAARSAFVCRHRSSRSRYVSGTFRIHLKGGLLFLCIHVSIANKQSSRSPALGCWTFVDLCIFFFYCRFAVYKVRGLNTVAQLKVLAL